MDTPQSQTAPPIRTRAAAKVTVQSSDANSYDQTAIPALLDVRLSETFAGDIEGESPVRALELGPSRNRRVQPALNRGARWRLLEPSGVCHAVYSGQRRVP
jgi:hypothetical protein